MNAARIVTAVTTTVLFVSIAWAHNDDAYNADPGAVASNPNWMKNLDNNLLISQLSLPGTHDTMATCDSGIVSGCSDLTPILLDFTRTQTMTLAEQLISGIRALDIRLGYEVESDLSSRVTSSKTCFPENSIEDCRFYLYHSAIWLGTEFNFDVLRVVINFLDKYPSEAIVMRIKRDTGSSDERAKRLFDERMNTWLSSSSYAPYFVPKHCNPSSKTVEVRLGDGSLECDARGKISLIYQFNDSSVSQDRAIGIWDKDYLLPDAQKQDYFKLSGIHDLYNKWEKIKAHFKASNISNVGDNPAPEKLYVNFLSGATDTDPDIPLIVTPYFVASGHSSPATDGSRVPTGLTTPGWEDSYPDFPRVNCFIGICTIAFEGTNTLSRDFIDVVARAPDLCEAGGVASVLYCLIAQEFPNPRFGLIMADFPGAGLIRSIIDVNAGIAPTALPPNQPPTANLDQQSYAVNEGGTFVADAGESSDPDGRPQPLEYEWTLTGLDSVCDRVSSDADALIAYNQALADYAVLNPDLSDSELVPSFLATPEGALAKSTLDAATPDPSQAVFNCLEDDQGSVSVIVSDGEDSSTAQATVQVNNVAPTVLITDPVVNENEEATLGITVTDPGVEDTFTLTVDWGDGSATSTQNLVASSVGKQTVSAKHVYLDNAEATASSSGYKVTVTVTDDDNGSGSNSGQIQVNNVAPTVSATVDSILENEVASIDLTIDDPGTLDTFSLEIDWGDGSNKDTFTRNKSPAGTQTFSRSHRYLDDKAATSDDDYDVKIKVLDKDGGEGETETAVTVENVDPVAAIDSITDEAGNVLGSDVSVLLAGLKLVIQASFTDQGTRDTHALSINWGDGTAVSQHNGANSPVVDNHTYQNPGNFNLVVTVTDDDGGSSTANFLVQVVDATGATANAIAGLAGLLDDPQLDPAVAELINDALAKLNGNADGGASNGAVDKFDADEINAALGKLQQAFEILAEAPPEDQNGYASLISQLALAAKSALLEALDTAKSLAVTPEDWDGIEAAELLIAKANEKLLEGDAEGAVTLYRKALGKLDVLANA